MDISIESVVFFLGKAICHQLPERSIMVDGHTIPICARCSGIYIGIFTSLVYLAIKGKFRSNNIPSIKNSFLLLIFLFPLVIDGFGSYLGIYTTNNITRVITGVMFGVTLPMFVVPLLSRSRQTNNPVITKFFEFFIPLIIATVFAISTSLEFIPLFLLYVLIMGTIISWGALLFYLYFKRSKNNYLSFGYSITSSVITLVALSCLHSLVETFLM